MMKLILIIAIALFSTVSPAEIKKAEVEEQVTEFKESKFLQVDAFDIPKDLKVIENQIAQNAIDVIILTGKYTVNYSAMRPDGYNKNYLNFYGVKVSILPIKESSSEYVLKLFYYNWTTNKYDKTITRRISKYNVLNEMRFAMFDLILGPDVVKENRDILEKKNFERIQAVREMVEEQEKREKKRKKEETEAQGLKKNQPQRNEDEQTEEKLKRETKKKAEQTEETIESENQKQAKVDSGIIPSSGKAGPAPEDEEAELEIKKSQSAAEKLSKKKVAEKEIEEKKTEPTVNAPQVSTPEPEKQEPGTPKTVSFSLNAGVRFDSVDASGLIQAKTNLNYLNLGADYRTDVLAKYPWGYGFSLNAGIPVKKEKYQISVSRALEGGVFKTFLSKFRLGGGVEYSSLVFANLPGAGEGLKIVQNDLLYGKFKFSIQFNLFSKEMLAGVEHGTSFSQKSNVNKQISVTKDAFFFQTQVKGDHSAELRVTQSNFTGYFSGKSSGLALLYVYNFGN